MSEKFMKAGFMTVITLVMVMLITGSNLMMGQATPVQADSPDTTMTENSAMLAFQRRATPTPVARQLSSSGGVILLNPFIGPATSPVTVYGQGWRAGDQLIVYLLDNNGTEYAVASTVADSSGEFSVNFFVPSYWANEAFVTVVARALNRESSAQAFYTITDAVPQPSKPQPQPTATPVSRNPQGVVVAGRLNVRTGPGLQHPRIAQLDYGQAVPISGKNGGWWRINYPTAFGDYGWVSGSFLRASNVDNVPFIQAPLILLPTATPRPFFATATPRPVYPVYQCNPGQWSGCGGANCPAGHVSQCGENGQWGQCVWDPGHCSDDDDDDNGYYDDDDDDDSDDDDDDGYNASPNPPSPPQRPPRR